MKHFLFTLSILLCICLCACSTSTFQPEPSPAPLPELWEDSIPATTEADVQVFPEETVFEPEPAEGGVMAPALAEGPDGSLVLILTDYYSLTLPHEWANTCVYTTAELDSGVYNTSIYECNSYWAFGGGHLCTLQLIPTGEDYTFFPSFKFLCVLNTPKGAFNLVAIFPTDVQFDANTAEIYNQMASELQEVLTTLKPAQGIELALP